MKTVKLLGTALLMCLFVACGGGSGGDDDDDNTNTGDNPTADQVFAEETSIAATESSKQIVASQQSDFIPIGPVINSSPTEAVRNIISARALNTTGQLASLPVGPVVVEEDVEDGECGGTFSTVSTITTPDDETQFFPSTVELDGDFNNFCIGENGSSITYNGTIDALFDFVAFDQYTFTVTYNLTYVTTLPISPNSGRIEGTETCTLMGDVETCSFSSSYTSANGTVYTSRNVEIDGNQSSGFNITGTIEDDEGNTFEIDVSGFVLCENGNVQSGEIVITLANQQVINVTYPNCNECIITYQGVARTVPQSSE